MAEQTPPDIDALAREWGRVIRQRREMLQLRQVDLADQLNVRQQTVSSWENGDAVPSSRIMPKLVARLGIPPDDLYRLHRESA